MNDWRFQGQEPFLQRNLSSPPAPEFPVSLAAASGPSGLSPGGKCPWLYAQSQKVFLEIKGKMGIRLSDTAGDRLRRGACSPCQSGGG